jgi:hypothetical protein
MLNMDTHISHITDALNKTQVGVFGLESSVSYDEETGNQDRGKMRGFTLSPVKIGKPNF